MKTRILKKLKSVKKALPEKELMEELNVSPQVLEKIILELIDAGYAISSTDKGVELTNEPDVLFPWEFENREARIHHFPEVDSTMNVAKEMAKDGCPHFTVIIAERQKKGRGRLKRNWVSEKGGLYFTIVLRKNIPVTMAHMFNFSASLSLAKVLQTHFSLRAMVKWPNDVFVGDKKISGLLSEIETDDDRVVFVNIGIGINVNNDPAKEEPNATSLQKLLGKEILRKHVLSRFLDEFETVLQTKDMAPIISEWKKYTLTLGREVRVVTSRETTEGTAVDVDNTGALIVKLNDGTHKKIIYGDCFIR